MYGGVSVRSRRGVTKVSLWRIMKSVISREKCHYQFKVLAWQMGCGCQYLSLCWCLSVCMYCRRSVLLTCVLSLSLSAISSLLLSLTMQYIYVVVQIARSGRENVVPCGCLRGTDRRDKAWENGRSIKKQGPKENPVHKCTCVCFLYKIIGWHVLEGRGPKDLYATTSKGEWGKDVTVLRKHPLTQWNPK